MNTKIVIKNSEYATPASNSSLWWKFYGNNIGCKLLSTCDYLSNLVKSNEVEVLMDKVLLDTKNNKALISPYTLFVEMGQKLRKSKYCYTDKVSDKKMLQRERYLVYSDILDSVQRYTTQEFPARISLGNYRRLIKAICDRREELYLDEAYSYSFIASQVNIEDWFKAWKKCVTSEVTIASRNDIELVDVSTQPVCNTLVAFTEYWNKDDVDLNTPDLEPIGVLSSVSSNNCQLMIDSDTNTELLGERQYHNIEATGIVSFTLCFNANEETLKTLVKNVDFMNNSMVSDIQIHNNFITVDCNIKFAEGYPVQDSVNLDSFNRALEFVDMFYKYMTEVVDFYTNWCLPYCKK